MTRQKSFKTRVRTRMDKTGESYAAARRQLIPTSPRPTSDPAAEVTSGSITDAAPDLTGDPAADPATGPAEPEAAPPPPAGADGSVGVGSVRRTTSVVGDGKLRERTGRGWDEWFALLDGWGATARRHVEIARWLHEEHVVDGWWAQSITVGYEQERGLREPAQKCDGTYSASASKTIGRAAERVTEAFTDPLILGR